MTRFAPDVHQALEQTLEQAAQAQWSREAIRDTVAAIAREPAFRRELKDTLWSRIWREIVETLGELFRFASGNSELGRRLVLILLVVLALLAFMRFFMTQREGYALRNRLRRDGTAMSALGLADADRIAATGDFTAAAHALYGVLAALLANRGRVRTHPSKTAGDYAREMRRRGAPEHRSFDAFRRRYDRVLFRELVCTAEEYAALRADADRIASADAAQPSSSRAA